LASGATDGTLVLWEAATGRRLRTLDGHNSWVTCVAFAPDGATLAAGTSEHALVLWNGVMGERIHTLETPAKYVTDVAFAPDGRSLASASYGHGHGGQVALWDAETGTCEMRIRIGHVSSLAFSPDGGRLALGSGVVAVWDVATRQKVHSLQGRTGARVRSLAFSGDGTTLAAGGWDGTVDVWHLDGERAGGR